MENHSEDQFPVLTPEESIKSETSSASSVSSIDVQFGNCLVVGGCGFLGRHIVKFLLAEPSATSIAVMDIAASKDRFEGVIYHIGDITKPEQVRSVIDQVKPRCIFNTASPHAYIDHEHADDNFYVNVDGNRNLLEAAAQVGTVMAFVYTSSGPIVASRGKGYDHADETMETLAVSRNGDPYHVAKAIGDKMTLDANGKYGFYTATIRPTALYGEGDYQMVEPVIRALEDGETHIWMGWNNIDMDVVYVGHVAKAEILAAKGLLRRHFDLSSPKVDGEAFNITDDEPCHPWTFFRKYWVLAGDETPLSSIWKIPHTVVMMMAHTAEWITCATSWGKARPKMLKVERMEFVLYTRTYNIDKARKVLGFKPWEGQPHASQDDAVKASVDWYLSPKVHGPARLFGVSHLPEVPFRLISKTGAFERTNFPTEHYCVRNAQIMALTHNTIFRALNSIYNQAPNILPGTQDASDFLSYCRIVFDFVHHHHVIEDLHYFPQLQKHIGNSSAIDTNLEQHRNLEVGLENLRKYAETTSKTKYNGILLRILIDKFAPGYQEHMEAEIGRILDLHDKIDSATLRKIDKNMRNEAEKDSDIFKAGPLYLVCQDKNFLVDNQKIPFPELPFIAPYIVDWFLAPRHKAVWRFAPSNMYGVPRKPVEIIREPERKVELSPSTTWTPPAKSMWLDTTNVLNTILLTLAIYTVLLFSACLLNL